MRRTLVVAGLFCLLASRAMAQDPVKVDPKHYKLEFENEQVRVLRIHYGPHEKSVMHSHPDGVVVAVNDQDAKFLLADGKSVERRMKAGEALWIDAETHLPENLRDKPFEVILIEIKARDGAGGASK